MIEHFWLTTIRSRLWISPNGSLSMLLEGCSSIYVFIHLYMSTNHFTFWGRYGVSDPLAGRAWQILGESVYSSTRRWGVASWDLWGLCCKNFHLNLNHPIIIDLTCTFTIKEFSRQGVDCEATKAWNQVINVVWSKPQRQIDIFHALYNFYNDLRDLTWYPLSSVLTAWELLLAASPNLGSQPSYLYDLVDVTRQVKIYFNSYA